MSRVRISQLIWLYYYYYCYYTHVYTRAHSRVHAHSLYLKIMHVCTLKYIIVVELHFLYSTINIALRLLLLLVDVTADMFANICVRPMPTNKEESS
jgi:hypothetical protein